MVHEFAPASRRCSKKSSRRVPRAAFCSCSTRLPVLAPPHARWPRGHGGLTPPSPLLRPHSPSVTDAVLFGRPPGRQLDLQCQVRAPPATAPGQPHHNARDPLWRQSPRPHVGCGSVRTDTRLGGTRARYFRVACAPQHFNVGMLGIRPGTCRAGLQTPNALALGRTSGTKTLGRQSLPEHNRLGADAGH